MARNDGFAFIWLLFALATLGVGLAAVGQAWQQAAQRERERELLFIGDEFRRAIGGYYDSSPDIKHYPRRLEDLLADDRTPGVRRHLRRIYRDPMTGNADWGLIMQGDQILGVFSQSRDKPIKRANFATVDSAFVDSLSYADWRFVYTPAGSPSAGVAALAADREALARDERRRAALPAAPANSADTPGGGGEPAAVVTPRMDLTAGLPTEGWACVAARANDLRACGQAGTGSTPEATRDCKLAAWRRFQKCMEASGGGTPPLAGPY